MFLLYTAQTREHRRNIDICCHKNSLRLGWNEPNLNHSATCVHLHLPPTVLPARCSSPAQRYRATHVPLFAQFHSHTVQEGWFLAHGGMTRLPQRGHSYQRLFRKNVIRIQLEKGHL